ncbi:hypothetical protein [Flavobacterium sp. JAS]|uniref:hypothetical protein n=1 Tax=Flavobacterium sp. JAS TaxID=2897329 RepID=UPI001E522D8E|nr:hypothetical protein [Flavobacterium sp. JAS]MCD0470603.1 hypothetical protein [Flavobacterium sp. JAS]
MKTILLVLLAIGLNLPPLQAQARQRKMLLEQIAALKIYIDYGKKGYGMVKNGLNLIEDLKDGEMSSHLDYFVSLKKVSPKIKNYIRVAQIIDLQLKIVTTYKKTTNELLEDDLFYGSELDYIQRSFERVFQNCNRTLEELLTLTTDSTVEMKDAKRLERIDLLYQTMLKDYTFCKNFSHQALLLSHERGKEKNEVQYQRALQDL